MIRISFTSVLSRPNLIHVSLLVAKMNLFSPSPLQADVNSVLPRQNGRKRSIQFLGLACMVLTKITVLLKYFGLNSSNLFHIPTYLSI